MGDYKTEIYIDAIDKNVNFKIEYDIDKLEFDYSYGSINGTYSEPACALITGMEIIDTDLDTDEIETINLDYIFKVVTRYGKKYEEEALRLEIEIEQSWKENY